MKTFKAVLFDLDGTLLDTLDDLADSMNAVLLAQGFPVHPVDAYRYFVGDGIENLVKRSLPYNADATTIASLKTSMGTEYQIRWKTKTKPYPGICQLLDELVQRTIKIAILSNKPDDFTKKIVSELLSDYVFVEVFGNRHNFPLKPDPASALFIANESGIHPSEWIYVGDTATDMKTATAAGMYAVGALWGFRTKKELVDNGAKVVVERPEELLRFF